jgi:putative transposase
MPIHETLSHTKWDCKYHIVFIPKYRRKALYKELRRHLGDVFRSLPRQRESHIEEGHLMSDHVHMRVFCISPNKVYARIQTAMACVIGSRDSSNTIASISMLLAAPLNS